MQGWQAACRQGPCGVPALPDMGGSKLGLRVRARTASSLPRKARSASSSAPGGGGTGSPGDAGARAKRRSASADMSLSLYLKTCRTPRNVFIICDSDTVEPVVRAHVGRLCRPWSTAHRSAAARAPCRLGTTAAQWSSGRAGLTLAQLADGPTRLDVCNGRGCELQEAAKASGRALGLDLPLPEEQDGGRRGREALAQRGVCGSVYGSKVDARALLSALAVRGVVPDVIQPAQRGLLVRREQNVPMQVGRSVARQAAFTRTSAVSVCAGIA